MADVAESIYRRGVDPKAAQAAEAISAACVPLTGFRLAGGTALSWHLGHRLSEDLDFFTYETGGVAEGARTAILTRLRSADPDLSVIGEEAHTLHVSFRGCRVSFFERPFRWSEPGVVVREEIVLTGVRDVAVLKWIGINTRGAKKDFYDLDALTRHGLHADALYDAITNAEPEILRDGTMREGLVRSLTYFEDAETDPDPVTLERRSWAQVKANCAKFAREMEGAVSRRKTRG